MRKMLLLIPLAVVFLAAGVYAESGKKAGDPEKGKSAFAEYCVKCHDASRPMSKTKDRDGWEATVERMSANHNIRFGSPIPQDAMDEIIEHLARERGKKPEDGGGETGTGGKGKK